MLELTMLPARQGDALWIRWGDEVSPHQLIIDMGTEEIGKQMRQRLEGLDASQRTFELLVVTHVDRDHIGGILTCLAEAEPLAHLKFKDVWFNGWTHLNGGFVTQPEPDEETMPASGLESFGPAQGERLSNWLREQTWNKAFAGRSAAREPGLPPPKITLADNLTLTLLGPTRARLQDFIPKWKDEVQLALEKGSLHEVSAGLEAYGSKSPPDLIFPGDLKLLAETRSSRDTSEANGSSISLMLEYKGRRLVLAGDAYADDLVEGLTQVAPNETLQVDAFKLPHHGSKNNVNQSLVESVSCSSWLFSTDGTQFRHPDAVAIARVVSYSAQQPVTLFFNVPSTFNNWWSNSDWKAMYRYETEYGDATDGLTLGFSVDDNE
jgi:hypothetical protein